MTHIFLSCFADRSTYVEKLISGMKKEQEPLLKVQDRIVWLSDYGPEYGVVRWIGCLPDTDLVAGIEFVSTTLFLQR